VSTKELLLPIETREKTGTTGSNALRRHGKIPAVLYGHGSTPQHIAFDYKQFEEVLHHGGRNGVLTLTVNGKKADIALVRDVQRHQVSRKIAHVDLQRVSAHEAVHAKLPVVAAGTPRGVRDFSGVLDVVLHEIEVEGPVDELPEQLTVDVTGLGIGQHITAADVVLPKGFKLLTPPDTTVVAVEASKTAQHVEEAASGATAEQATPEVIGAKPEA
jgi:large subunit ribosomal protein L25